MIDEIDKLGTHSINGDPSAALLEVLDPEQNAEFMDHYLDIPYDLSKVLFICTANDISTIPHALLDRMEVIHVPGYTTHEKQQIALKYLIPRASEECGVSGVEMKISDEILKTLIHRYCREPGVRNLQKAIEGIFRQTALDIVTNGENAQDSVPKELTEEFLKKSLGVPHYVLPEIVEDAPPGCAVGLAYNSVGGSILNLESVAEPVEEGRGGSVQVKFTGSLGDVLKESAQIAITYSRVLLRKLYPDAPEGSFLSKNDISLHLPSGAIPKDGPSAGIALASAFTSLATGKRIDPRLGMTGEITLTGRVLPIGGVQEKALGAQRSGIRRLIFPAANQLDWEELEEYIKSDFDEVYFVSHFDEVYNIIFNTPHSGTSSTSSSSASSS